MQRYLLKKPTTTPEGQVVLTSLGVVALSDDAHGADEYLDLKRQGYSLEAIRGNDAEAP